MRSFLLIVVGALGCSLLGGGFGWLIGTLSPEFIDLLVQPSSVAEPRQFAAALGLVLGLVLGMLAVGFGLVVDTLRLWAMRNKPNREQTPRQAVPPIVPRVEEAALPAGPPSFRVRRS